MAGVSAGEDNGLLGLISIGCKTGDAYGGIVGKATG